MIRIELLSLGGILLAGAVVAQTAGDPAEGRKMAGQCSTCHGIEGYAKIPIAPHIGGEPAGYIASQLRAFREGDRTHEMMSVVAKSLTDQQIADLSAWYANHAVSATLTGDGSSAPVACVSCHGENGIGLTEDVPNLAGETNIYIDTQLKSFRAGKRTHEVMSAIAAGLTDEEIRAAADWYASVKIEIEVAE